MKVEIRFLRQGLIQVEAPENFDQMAPEKKLEWASTVLEGCTDHELVNAMSDFEKPRTKVDSGFFDEAPEASAVEKEAGEGVIVQTEEWKLFRAGEGRKIAEEKALPPEVAHDIFPGKYAESFKKR
jgi:hypothetical protein